MIESVGTSQTGSTTAVDVSRYRSMSDSWIFWNPRMEEPSNPIPSDQIPDLGSVESIQFRGRD